MRVQINKYGLDLKEEEARRDDTKYNYLDMFVGMYCCKHCCGETFGLWKYIVTRDFPKDSATPYSPRKHKACISEIKDFLKMERCPFCGERLTRTRGNYLELNLVSSSRRSNLFDEVWQEYNDFDFEGCNASKWDENIRPALEVLSGGKERDGIYQLLFNFSRYSRLSDCEIRENENIILNTMSNIMAERRIEEDKKVADEMCENFLQEQNSAMLFASVSVADTSLITQSPEELKKFIQNLISIESNIYSLEKRLGPLYYQKIVNDRKVNSRVYSLEYEKVKNLENKLELAEKNYKECQNKLFYTETRLIRVSVKFPAFPEKPRYKTLEECEHLDDFPKMPVEPILKKPGLFNKAKTIAENNALMEQYEFAICEYNKAIDEYKIKLEAENEKLKANYQQRFSEYEEKQKLCLEEEKRLKEEKEKEKEKEVNIAREELKIAEERVNAIRSELEAFTEKRIEPKELSTPLQCPEYAIKTILDKEVEETEESLSKLIEAKYKYYNLGVIFGKYRDIVALSTFYEYLMSGRCTTLDGPNGAYNLYEAECRANMIISQLSKVIELLEEIKQNQYMICDLLHSISMTLNHLDFTMGKAVESIENIESNTADTNKYLNQIAQNSDVIAHNTAVTAYYSKVNAELTNSLGYLIALS